MKVIAALNGLITSEIAALYALRYAGLFGLTLNLLHVANPKDEPYLVSKSMDVIEEEAAAIGVTIERVWLSGEPVRAIRKFISENRSDLLFCGTRKLHGFFEDSLSDRLSRLALPVDLAVVKAVRVDGALRVTNMVLPIQEDRLSVKKFAFFAGLAMAHGASAEIYSITPVDSKRLADLDLPATRMLLRKVDDRLLHYTRLARLMHLPIRIRHALARNEVDRVLHHLAHQDFQLMVVGGQRLSKFARLVGGRPIERLFQQTPINTIAFYARGNE